MGCRLILGISLGITICSVALSFALAIEENKDVQSTVARPIVVSVEYLGEFCASGTVIAPKIILTSAARIAGRDYVGLSIKVGNLDSHSIGVASVAFHNEYNPTTFVNNLALIELTEEVPRISNGYMVTISKDSDVKFNDGVELIAYPHLVNCTNNSTTLSTFRTRIVPNSDCVKKYEDLSLESLEGQVCSVEISKNGTIERAGLRSHGGPVMSSNPDDRRLVAIVSTSGIRKFDLPDIYTIISPPVYDWIEKTKNEMLNANEDSHDVTAFAEDSKFLYQVSLRLKNHHFCGGSILNKRWILTAAQCLDGLNDTAIAAVVGTTYLDDSNGKVYESMRIVSHPRYMRLIFWNDIGLIKVNKDIEFNDKVQPVKLPGEKFDKKDYPAVLSGWGTTTNPGRPSNELQSMKFKIIEQKECLDKSSRATNKNMCALNEKDDAACHGDSGGPLVADGQQIGVMSWGTPCAKGKPDVFIRVYSYVDWINMHIKKDE